MIAVEELEAQIIVMAHAACSIADGCELCPLYREELETTRQQGICQEKIGLENVRNALITLRGNKR